ncbi:MAG: phosphatidylglycerophosphatase A [Burkholderiales bacterium]|nr:phosphatidylglycerophosphatase A [Burkholderiales bacterium]
MNTLSEMPRRASLRFVVAHPAHFVAFGFGAGLSPVAPGTMGTVVAFPVYYGLASVFSDAVLLGSIALALLIGIWVCQVTGRHLGVHDHSGMVWDEIAAFMLVLYFIPAYPIWWAFAFLLFRIFDIFKPPPIRRLDQKIRNGFGVMLDDVVAAFYTLICLAAAYRAYTFFML